MSLPSYFRRGGRSNYDGQGQAAPQQSHLKGVTELAVTRWNGYGWEMKRPLALLHYRNCDVRGLLPGSEHFLCRLLEV